ncbi:MAG TPA: carbohydrate ABC transporter permease [Chloroflexota bacterium]|nr:carbohydrate ABC transporter permease [Chloroflexota bacterium]
MLAIPPILTLVPMFILVRGFGLINTLWGLIIPYIATGEALAIFVLRTFFAGLPEELFEAATIDGASQLQAFVRIALPLVRPALGTVAIIQLLAVWNDYVWPLLVVTDDSVKTLTVGLVGLHGRFETPWGELMAGYVLASLPVLILFFFTVRQFVTGLTSGALKL